jgi:hypothetical protein
VTVLEMVFGAVEEALLFEEVARGVAGEREFEEYDDGGGKVVGAARIVEDRARVAREVADGGVRLCERDSHETTILEGCGHWGVNARLAWVQWNSRDGHGSSSNFAAPSV